jgi:hypothetical protein
VTVVGCLRGPELAGATGTAGSPAADRARARESGSPGQGSAAHGRAANARYTLTNAAVESGGAGRSGAGGTGGPLISPGSSLDLDGVPADAQASVNKQVRITGRVDAMQSTEQGAAASRSGGSSSARDDVRANSTTIAAGARENGTNRRVTVETVQVVAQTCPAR